MENKSESKIKEENGNYKNNYNSGKESSNSLSTKKDSNSSLSSPSPSKPNSHVEC